MIPSNNRQIFRETRKSISDAKNYSYPSHQLELYPRLRHTEFYLGYKPTEEYQSRRFEHPSDKLQNQNANATAATTTTTAVNKSAKIQPPQSSDMRVYRNSYFS